jgi:Pentapeptide repeats (9 copies)
VQTTIRWTREQLDEIVKNGKKFHGMRLQGVNFDGMNLEKANFRGCSLPWSSFKDCNLKHAIFEGANCTGANFNGANVHRANFKDATMCDAKFDVVDAFGVTVTMDCRAFSHLQVNGGFWWGLIYYAFLMDPIAGPDFNPEEVKEKLSLLYGPERFATLKRLYTNRQM